MIDELTDDRVSVTLVNVNQLEARRIIVQAGGYAEHQLTAVKVGNHVQSVEGAQVTVELSPGAGARLTLIMKRHVNVPTLEFPWN